MLKLTDIPLSKVLLREPVICPQTTAYQAILDDGVDRWLASCDPGSGLSHARGVDLPHTTRPDYWLLSRAEAAAITSDAAAQVYKRNAGRAGTAPLCRAAWCWHSPMSRHHGDAALLQIVLAGLRHTVSTIRPDGLMSAYGLNGESWAHGWDIEGVIYAMVLCRDELPADLQEMASARFRSAGQRMMNLEPIPAVIGSYGNQRLVYALGLQLYGQVLDEPAFLAFSDATFTDALRNILDASGQVIEQHGPCMHYSMTAFIYGWLNLAVRDDQSEQERVARCLEWFRLRYTRSGYPLAGPSTRKYYETMPTAVADLLPAAEQLAHQDPMIREWLLSLPPAYKQQLGVPTIGLANEMTPTPKAPALTLDGSHGASTLMWSILMSPGERELSEAQRAAAEGHSIRPYDGVQLLKRMPLRYVIAHQRYQTHFNYRDYQPFSGIQTWAWEDEPPILHPTPMAPSTTQAYTLDTARQGTSHNWGDYGAGAIGINGYLHGPDDENGLPILVARYDWFWCVVVFTEASTLCLEFGQADHPRRRFWTLNRVQAADPEISAGRVGFAGRRGALYSTVAAAPELQTLDPGHPWTAGVRQLVYDCGGGPAGFALSGEAVTMDLTGLTETWAWRFQDATGSWRVQLNPQFGEPNPGNICVDTYQMAYRSYATRVD